MSSLRLWPLHLGSPSRVAVNASRLPSRLFNQERRAERSAGWTGCPGSVGVSAGHKLPLGYLMQRSLPQNAEAQPSNPARHPRGLPPGRSVAGVLRPAGESPVAGAAPGTAAGCSRKRRIRESARARGAALLGDGAARAPCWPGCTCAPSPGSEVRPASHPGSSNFNKPGHKTRFNITKNYLKQNKTRFSVAGSAPFLCFWGLCQ